MDPSITEVIPYLTHPLALVGYVLMLFFSMHRALIKSGIIPPLNQQDGASVVHALLEYGFWIAALIIVAGVTLQYVQNQPDVIQEGEAAAGGTVINQSGSGNTVNINDSRLLLELINQKEKDSAKLATLSHQLGVTESALSGFFTTLEQEQIALDKLPAALQKIAQRHREMLAQLASLKHNASSHQALLGQAETAIAQGQHEQADALIRQYIQQETDSHQLNIAAANAMLGTSALARFQFAAGVTHLQQATALVPESQPQIKRQYLLQWADALSDFGEHKGRNDILEQAINTYQEALTYVTREDAPPAVGLDPQPDGPGHWPVGRA